LGFFTVLGIQKGVRFGLNPGICVVLGTVTGCFGGVIRDILLNNIPLIFRREIYATACILGGIIYFILYETRFPKEWLDVTVMLVVFLIRFMAVKYNFVLPDLYSDSDKKGRH
jgi:uncharacterized membrane protein YeiH